jgi:hypothetical protein
MPPVFSPVTERFIHAVIVEDPGDEEGAATRRRLQDAFPRGAPRRTTQPGLLIGSVLAPIGPRADDALVYASTYAEDRALEAYLASFPEASPTLFQTSIHPSAVQQALIARRQPIGEFLPLTGRRRLVAHAVQAALLAPAPRVILCGGEERGGWLQAAGAASAGTFAFALALTAYPSGARGTLGLAASAGEEGELELPEFFAALRDRRPLRRAAAPGLEVILDWR